MALNITPAQNVLSRVAAVQAFLTAAVAQRTAALQRFADLSTATAVAFPPGDPVPPAMDSAIQGALDASVAGDLPVLATLEATLGIHPPP